MLKQSIKRLIAFFGETKTTRRQQMGGGDENLEQKIRSSPEISGHEYYGWEGCKSNGELRNVCVNESDYLKARANRLVFIPNQSLS